MHPLRTFAALRSREVEAQVSVSDVGDAFYRDFATEESGRYWWWCREILIDPNEVIVEGSNELYRVPFTITDAGVEFGEPKSVKVQYVDTMARSEQVAAALDAIASVRGEKVAARFSERPKTRPMASTEGGSMDVSQLRSVLNLSADVPDEEVLKIAAQRLSSTEDPAGGGGQEEEGQEGQEGQEPRESGGTSGTPTPAPPAEEPQASTNGVVAIDASALAELREAARVGVEERNLRLSAESTRILDQAVEDGKIPPARRQHWASLMEADREGTIHQLSQLAENVIPIHARGDTRHDGEGASGSEGFGYPAGLFPEVAARKERIAAGARSRVATDGG